MARRFVVASFFAVLLALAPSALAQGKDYPIKPIRIVVPWAPGGSTDLTARTFGQFLAELWGQPVLNDNRPGAGGTLGSAVTAAAEPDGYTLQLVTSSHAVAPSLYKSLPFDTTEDFTPIILLGEAPYFLVVHPSLGVTTQAELVALARAKPGILNYASSGNGTGNHIAGELFNQLANTDIKHIPYRGVAPALVDLLEGRVQIMFADVTVFPRVKSGRLKVLSVASDHRSYAMPEVPTVEEAGIAGFQATYKTLWYAMMGPKGIPKPIVAKLNEALNQALKDKKTLERLQSFAFEPIGGAPEVLVKHLRDDEKNYRTIISRGRITID